MPSFLGHLSVDELALLSFMAWNDGTTTEDRARHTAIQTYDEIEGEDPGKHGFTNFDSGSAKAEVEMLRQQVRDLERAAGQQQRQPRDQTQPPEHRFNGVCNNCNGYGHLARDCAATRRPDSSGKGSGRGGQGVQPNGRGGHQGVQPAGKGAGGKGDAGGRGRGRAVAAVNNSAPGPHGPNLTDAQFDKWLLTQRP